MRQNLARKKKIEERIQKEQMEKDINQKRTIMMIKEQHKTDHLKYFRQKSHTKATNYINLLPMPNTCLNLPTSQNNLDYFDKNIL